MTTSDLKQKRLANKAARELHRAKLFGLYEETYGRPAAASKHSNTG